MFNSQMLDAAIGLVFVYFFLSLLCSVIIEMVTGLTKKRPRMLRDGILSLLQDSKALDKLYEQPLFMGNSNPKNLIGSLLESFLPLPSKKKRVPSYISSRSFVLSLLESLRQHPDIDVKELLKDKISPAGNKDQIKEFLNKLNSLPNDSNIKKALLPLLKSADSDPDKAFKEVIDWYNKTMEEPNVKELLKDKISPPGNKDQIKEFLNKLNSLPNDSNIKKALLPLLKSAGSDLDKAFKDVNDWYNKTMEEPKIFEGILKEIKIPTIGDFKNVRNLVDSLPDDNAIKKALLPLLDTANKSWDKAIDNMEKWYDEAMDRVTGWYKRYSQAFALILAFFIALGLNADTFEIGKAIYRDQVLRNSLVQMAQEKTKEQLPPGATEKSDPDKKKIEEVNKYFKELSSINLPIGWPLTKEGFPDTHKIICGQENKDEQGNVIKTPRLLTPVKLLGILLTALMVSLGSNFWFDLLNKLVNMRNAGKKPLTKEEQEARVK